MRRFFIISLLAVFGVGSAFADINDSDSERRIAIPRVTPGVAIPREDWMVTREQRRPDNTAVYYMLTSEARQMVFSVYVDKSSACNSSEACLESALKNQSYKDARDLRRMDQGQFKVAHFFLDQPSGAPLKQAHVLAAAYVDGIWIDIHVSKSGKERPDMGSLVEFLKRVVVK